MKDMHGALNVHDPDFKASDFMTIEGFVDSLTHQRGPLVCFVFVLFCFLFWAILRMTHKMSLCM